MRKNIIHALTSPVVVVAVCLLAAATCFAFSNHEIDASILGFTQKRITPSKDMVTNSLRIDEKFTEIDVNRGVKVIYRITAGTPTAEVTAPKNIMDYVIVTVNKGTLKVTIDDDIQANGSLNTTVIVSGPQIGEYEASSAGHIIVESPLNLKGELDVDISSAAKVEFQQPVKAYEVSIEASSASHVIVETVEAEKGDIEVSSAAKITIGKAIGGTFDFDGSSAGSIKVKDCDIKTLSASASSAANVSINGNADNASLDASSGGSVGGNNLTVKDKFRKSASSGGRVSVK